MSKNKAWDEESVAQLVAIVGSETPVSNATVAKAAEEMDRSTRSIASKLRNLDMEVEPVVTTREKTFTEAEESELRSFVEGNAGQYTYAEIAAAVCGGKFNPRQVQGKVLAMELTGNVKPTPKKEVERKYTEAEEAEILQLMKDGAYLEDIAEALGKELNSIRGKCLSLSRVNEGLKIPAQKNHVSKEKVDALTELGDSVADLTVEEIAIKISKSERGVKAMLTKRGISCANYDGAKRRAKADAKKAEAAA